MKKKTLFATVGAGLSLALAAVAIGEFAGNRQAKEVGAVEVVSQTCDFSAKTANSTSYTSAWTYGAYTIYGGMNSNGSFAYCRFGGGKSAVITNKVCYINTTAAIANAISSVDVDVKAIATTQGFTVNSFSVIVASNADFSTVLDTISGTATAGSSTHFVPTSGTAWAANSFFKVQMTLTTTSTGSNVGIDINSVKYNTVTTFGTLASVAVATPANVLTFEGGETFTSAGLALTATDTDGNHAPVTSGFTTDYDAHVFTDADIGSKTVTVSYTYGSVTKTCTYNINVTETPKWDAIFGKGLGFTSEKGTTSTPITGNIAAGEQAETITSNGLFWTMDLNCNNNGIYFDADYTSDLAMGSTAFPATSCVFTSGIVSVSGAVKISKVIVDASAGGTTTLAVSVGGIAVGTAQSLTSAQVAYSFTPSAAAFGRVAITFSQPSTAKWIDIFRVRIYGTVDTSTNEGKAYTLAARIEQANACASSTENTQLITDYNADTTVKNLVDAISVIDYASAAVKSATVSYRNASLTCATKMAAISALGGGAGVVFQMAGSTTVIAVAVVSVLGLLTLAGVMVIRKKHN
jgi:hypothetical protein